MRTFASALGIALVVTACAPVTPSVTATVTAFDASEVAFIHQGGPNSLRGQAFLRQRDGGVVTCAGQRVWLYPEGGHSRERIGNIYGTTLMAAQAKARVDDPSAEYLRHTRQTICDAQGNFAFEGIANGRYFVVTSVVWDVGGLPQGGHVMAPIALTNGESKRLIIAP